MITFDVQDMTCGHCVGAITRAVQAAAPGAPLRIDLPTHRVEVDAGSEAQGDAIREAIREAGYTPVRVPEA
ncbi:MAG: heavy-metal-associated domain-containing protein [Leptothrix sp. (in: b-proteobacteria)]